MGLNRVRQFCSLFILAFNLTGLSAAEAPQFNFFEHDLKTLLAENAEGLIYIWSPGMPLSRLGIPQVQEAAKRLDLNLSILMDPFFNADPEAMNAAQSRRLEAQSLYSLGVLNHFPALVYYKDNKLSPRVFHGFEKCDGIVRFIQKLQKEAPVRRLSLGRRALRDDAPESEDLGSSLVKSREVNFQPTYFFRASADGSLLAVNTRQSNLLLEMNSEGVYSIPGRFDPIFGPDGLVVTVSSAYKYNFYKLEELLKTGFETPAIYTEKELSGVYQSIGFLGTDEEGQSKFRMISDQDRAAYRDYRIEGARIETLDSDIRLCSNMNIKMPILSKNGRELGALDLDENEMIVLKIGKSGRCAQVASLGLKTGKLALSHDGTRVAYHLYVQGAPYTDSSGWEVQPSADSVADIFIFDRITGKHYRLTKNVGQASIYPDFLENGDVVYASFRKDQKTAFSIVRPDYLQPIFKDVFEKIIAPSCSSCHNSYTHNSRLDFSKEENLRAFVRPKHPLQSALFVAVNDSTSQTRMPPSGERISKENQALLRDWIMTLNEGEK